TVTADTFIDFEPFTGLDAANAFPTFSWAIVRKLISPPDGLVSRVNQDSDMSRRFYDSYWAQVANDMYLNGLPIPYRDSLNLDYYRLIRPYKVDKLKFLPDQRWMTEQFIYPP